MTRKTRLFAALGLAGALVTGVAAAQQPAQPGLPPGHPPTHLPERPAPGEPGQRPLLRQLPTRPDNVPPGRPIGPGGRQLPPGHVMPRQGGARPAVAPAPAAQEHAPAAHGEEHCPGHGPTDPPHHVNWWQGLIGVDNEAAQKGGVHSLLWRYNDPQRPCDPRNQPPPFLASVLNFLLLGFIVYRFGRKPLADALVARKKAIMGDIDNATRLKNEAEARLDDYEDKLEHLEETLAELKAEQLVLAAAEKKHILEEAMERKARMRTDAEFRVAQERKAMRAQLLQEAVVGAVAAAEELLRKRAASEDLDRIAEDYLGSIPAALAGGEGRGPGGAPRAPHTPGAST